jgi:hypothetical protein
MAETSEDIFAQLKDGLNIDIDNLDFALIKQPNQYFHVAQQHALAISRRDKLDHEMDVLKASLDREIRLEAIKTGEKITESQIKAAIERDKEHRALMFEYLYAKREADQWLALKDSYQQRSYILKDLVSLHVSGYFGEAVGAKERGDARKRVIERRK